MDEILTLPASDAHVIEYLRTKDAKDVYKKIKDKFAKYFTYSKTVSHLSLAQHIPLTTFVDFSFNPPKIEKTPVQKTYSSIIVTENYALYREILAKQIPVIHIHSPKVIEALKDYDIVYVHDCPTYESNLEQLPQIVAVDADELFLDQKIAQVLSYASIIHAMNQTCVSQIPSATELIQSLQTIASFATPVTILNAQVLTNKIECVNESITQKISTLSINGSLIMQLLLKQMPKEIESLILSELKESQIPLELVEFGYPLKLNEISFKKRAQEQTQSQAVSYAKRLISQKKYILQVPQLLSQFERLLIVCDLICGLRNYMVDYSAAYAQESEYLCIHQSKNLLIANPKSISYELTSIHPAALVTGANSGGKTTLLEHVIQLSICQQLGIPVSGAVSLPNYTAIYYFAKNKGSANKGAFETMLTQLSSIQTSGRVLILADEMEAVTEPSVAAKIMASTLTYFLSKNANAIFATHLGGILAHNIPSTVRIDGIEAIGIDDTNKIIIDHNPRLNYLAKSTPELIIQKLAKEKEHPFFMHLTEALL